MNDNHQADENITNTVINTAIDINVGKLANNNELKKSNDLTKSNKDELIIKYNDDNNNNNELLIKTTCEANDLILPNTQNIPEKPSTDNNDLTNTSNHLERTHIPYILNGELYQIQTQDGEAVTVKCKHCPSDRVYRGSIRSTGNFHMHIKRRHPYLLSKLHDMKVNALIERRDRLLRNRKIPQNRCNRRIQLKNAKIKDLATLTSTLTPTPTLTPATTPPPSRTPTRTPISSTTSTSNSELSFHESDTSQIHKLKIKTVFQRHQLQQQKFTSADFKTLNHIISDNNGAEMPLNYSLKFPENNASLKTNMNSAECCMSTLTALTTDHKEMLSQNTVKLPFSPYRSVNNSYTRRTVLDYDPAVINNYDHLHFVNVDNEAIDLSLNSSNNLNYSNDSHSITNLIDFNSNCNHLQRDAAHPANSNANCHNNIKFNQYLNKWQHTLSQLDMSLHGVQRALHVRNQIEANRMFLDIAKFKFLHPGFQFN